MVELEIDGVAVKIGRGADAGVIASVNEGELLIIAPLAAALCTRIYRHQSHRTVANIGANISACTNAISKYQLSLAMRPPPEAYADHRVRWAPVARRNTAIANPHPVRDH